MIKAAVVLLFTFNILACNPIQQASQNKIIHSPIPFSCIASQSSCEITSEQGTFTVEFSGQLDDGKIKTELPFEIQLTFESISESFQLKNVNSYLEGKTMFMGKVPVFFEMTDKSNKPVIAQTLLASCSEEMMTWRLWFKIEIEQNDMTTQQDFFIDFNSQRL